ncbi:hypothetical protein TNCV_4011181 [Trichonephila clavipes]|nr:hypothetical protein TNCV_4011181 [Trichonephila clavipes]
MIAKIANLVTKNDANLALLRRSRQVPNESPFLPWANSRRAASSLVWLGEGVERWETPHHPKVSSLKIGVETSQIVLSLV